MARRARIAGLVTGFVLLLAGCGGGGGSASGGPTDLTAALGTVKDSVYSRAYFEWSDLAAVRKLAGLPPSARHYSEHAIFSRWIDVFGVGTDGLAALEPRITDTTSIDFLAAESAIGIGQPPDHAMRIDGSGVDAAAVTHSLLALGAKRESSGGRTFLALGGQNTVNLNSPLVSLGAVNQLDRVVASGHTVVGGSANGPVDSLLGGGRSLSADSAYTAAASCLGSVIVAVIAPPAKLNAATPAELLAFGVLKPSSSTAPVREVLCAVDTSAGVAEQQAARMKTVLGPASQVRALPQSRVQSVTVKQIKTGSIDLMQGTVTLKPNAPVGFFYQAMSQGTIGLILGALIHPQAT